MKNFARLMGLPFGSAGAHTYPKSGQVAPPPPSPRAQLDQYNVYSINLRKVMRVSRRSAQSQNGKNYKGQGVTLFLIKGVQL